MGIARGLVWLAIACKPGCMARGRYKQRKVAADQLARAAADSAAQASEPPPNVPAEPSPAASVSSSPVGDGSSFRRTEPLAAKTPPRPTSAPKQARSQYPQLAPWQQKRAEQSDLRRLGDLSKSLVKLHREETRLLRERDALIADLRARGIPWAALSMRTGLSRQALSKRVVLTDDT